MRGENEHESPVAEVTDFEKDKEGKFICPNCEKSMESISQTMEEIVRWKWNPDLMKYENVTDRADGDAEKPMCDNCGEHMAWDYGMELGY